MSDESRLLELARQAAEEARCGWWIDSSTVELENYDYQFEFRRDGFTLGSELENPFVMDEKIMRFRLTAAVVDDAKVNCVEVLQMILRENWLDGENGEYRAFSRGVGL